LNIYHSILALLLITGAAKANIVVRIRRAIVKIQCKGSSIAPIVPIATALKRVTVFP